MLYTYYRLAETKKLRNLMPEYLEYQPGRSVLELVSCMNEMLEAEPVLLRQENGNNLGILYEGISVVTEEINRYADVLAAISEKWPAAVLGGMEGLETGRITYTAEGNQVLMEKFSISGKSFQVLSGLYLQVNLPDEKTAYALYRLLHSCRRNQRVWAVERSLEGFLREQGIPYLSDGTLFCYIYQQEEIRMEDCLQALSVEKKLRLWYAFLQEKIQPGEFEWLWEIMEKREERTFLDWVVSLQKCLDELNYHVVNRMGFFSVTDARGELCTFDFERGGAAEKVFLKILFPLNLQA